MSADLLLRGRAPLWRKQLAKVGIEPEKRLQWMDLEHVGPTFTRQTLQTPTPYPSNAGDLTKPGARWSIDVVGDPGSTSFTGSLTRAPRVLHWGA